MLTEILKRAGIIERAGRIHRILLESRNLLTACTSHLLFILPELYYLLNFGYWMAGNDGIAHFSVLLYDIVGAHSFIVSYPFVSKEEFRGY